MSDNPFLPTYEFERTTASEALRICRNAIFTIETLGQNYRTPQGQLLTRADLSTLYKREKDLMARVATETSNSRVTHATFKHRV